MKTLSPLQLARNLTEYWSPRVIAELDDSYVKVAKLNGTIVRHKHDHEDELFLVLEGELRIEIDNQESLLKAGEMVVVPKGVMHQPFAESDCLVMLVERKSTQHTGDEVTEMTRSVAEQLRPPGS